MKKEQLLIIFAKNPKLGKVKTRLAKDLGDKKTLIIYTSLLTSIQNKFIKTEFDVVTYYSGGFDNIPNKFKLKPQKGFDLGKRMFNAFKENLGIYKKVIIIGTDCPFIGKRIVNKAFAALDKHEVVIGPSEDGGYYLIGIAKRKPRSSFPGFRTIFKDIEWSTEKVLQQTLKQFMIQGIKPYLLNKLYDIDTIKEYKRWKKRK